MHTTSIQINDFAIITRPTACCKSINNIALIAQVVERRMLSSKCSLCGHEPEHEDDVCLIKTSSNMMFIETNRMTKIKQDD